MKWILVFLTLTVNDDACHGPLSLLKHSDELFGSKAECEESFHSATFYKTLFKQEIVGFCMQIEPMMLSPKQADEKVDAPKCY